MKELLDRTRVRQESRPAQHELRLMTLDRRPFPRRFLGIQIETKGKAFVRRMSVDDVCDDVASLRDVVHEPADGAMVWMEIECRGDREERWRKRLDRGGD